MNKKISVGEIVFLVRNKVLIGGSVTYEELIIK